MTWLGRHFGKKQFHYTLQLYFVIPLGTGVHLHLLKVPLRVSERFDIWQATPPLFFPLSIPLHPFRCPKTGNSFVLFVVLHREPKSEGCLRRRLGSKKNRENVFVAFKYLSILKNVVISVAAWEKEIDCLKIKLKKI
jgi:hypothetical protein